MIGKIVALNFSPSAEIPNPGLAGNLRTSGTGPVYFTLPMRLRWSFLNHVRDLIRIERITSKAQCGVLSEFVIDVAEDIAMLIHDHTVILYDNAVRSTKITRVLNFINRHLPLLAVQPTPKSS